MQNRRNIIYVLATATLLAALFTGRALFFNIAYLFGLLIVMSFIWAWWAVRGFGIGRNTRTRRSQVGRYFKEDFIVRNLGIFPKLWLEVRDFSNLPDHRASHVVPGLGIRGQFNWSAKTLCQVRGEFRLGPMEIATSDPFGFFMPKRQIDATERLIVYPAIVEIETFQLPMGMLSGGEAQRYITQHVTTNAAGVRDYVPGDSINRIHWKSTARRQKLIVKEFELDPMVDIWVFLDLSLYSLVEDPEIKRTDSGAIISENGDLPRSTEEYGIVIGASLVDYFVKSERALGFGVYTPHREIFKPERGQRQLTRIMETLAIARSQSQYTLKEMLSLEAHQFTRGTTLVIITASHNPQWVEEAQILQRRGIRPMCVYIDPASFGGYRSDDVQGYLQLAKIPTIPVHYGDDLHRALQQYPV